MKHVGTAVGLLAFFAGVFVPPAVMLAQMRHTRHLATVRAGVLYRSGQLTTKGLARVLHDHHIRTIVCLRNESPATQAEQEWCAKNEVRFVRIAPRNWDGPPGAAPVDGPLREFLDVMADPASHPVLIHCFAGTHRTGGYVAVWRMEAEGWATADAMEEMRAMGYNTLATDLDINEYLSSYRQGALSRTADGR